MVEKGCPSCLLAFRFFSIGIGSKDASLEKLPGETRILEMLDPLILRIYSMLIATMVQSQ